MKRDIIDQAGYRHNVGIVLTNGAGQVLWARRVRNRDAWQFPQGGMLEGETVEQAMYRELDEELGLLPADVEIIANTKDWVTYDLPEKFIRRHSKPLCIGQKQMWFLLKLKSSESRIQLDHAPEPEFDDWRWVDYWFPVDQVIAFKQVVYQQVLKEFEPYMS